MRFPLSERRDTLRFGKARAGVWSRNLASERLDSFLRAHTRALVIVFSGVLGWAVVLWFVMSPLEELRGFALGAYLTGSIAVVYHWCVLKSGAVNGTMGHAAEQWTSTELQRLRRKGWRVINHLVFRTADIDHLAIGPAGVIVVETKWRSAATRIDVPDSWRQEAVEQVKRNERDVAGRLGWGARKDAQLTSLIVVWGPQVTQESDEAVLTPEGVRVIAGERLRSVLFKLSEDKLSADEVDRIYRELVTWVEIKDRWTAERSEPRPRTIAESAQEWVRRFGVGAGGFTAAAYSVYLNWWYFAVATVFVIVGLIPRRHKQLRSLATSWIVGTQTVTVLLVAALLVRALDK